jgi:tRNA modification GTPase
VIDSQVALLTAAQRGAVATIALLGPEAEQVLRRFFLPGNASLPYAAGQVRYGTWRNTSEVAAEGIVLTVVSQKHFEVHCHGGRAAVQSIISGLVDAGCQRLDQDAYLSLLGYRNLEQECLAALIQTQTAPTAAIALAQAQGTLRSALTDIDELLAQNQTSSALERLQQLAATFSFGRHLTEPWQVVLAGPPNVGKSSLLNALSGWQRAITSELPGTTRDIVRVEVAVQGWPITLEDTAGVRASEEAIELQGIERSFLQVKTADLVLLIVDGAIGLTQPHRQLASMNDSLLWVWNKADLAPPEIDCPGIDFLPTSAKNNLGIDDLLQKIVATLVPQSPAHNTPVLLSAGQHERVLSLLKQVTEQQHPQARAALRQWLG